MLKEIPCRCGQIKKNFKFDIGPFFIGECCEQAGYDALGNSSKKEPNKMDALLDTLSPKDLNVAVSSAPISKPGRGKLMDMNVPALKELAKSKGIELQEGWNKKRIVEEILK